jgi:sialate O-acetylesterase
MNALRTWILAGQSNMEGRGLLADADLTPDPENLAFTSAGAWEPAVDPLHQHDLSFTPVNRRLEGFAEAGEAGDAGGRGGERPDGRRPASWPLGAGLGVSFARAVRAATGEPVGLIPAAHSATSLEQWSPALAGLRGESLYGAMLERVRRAAAQRDIQLAGILWYQGETDADDLGCSATYAARFDRWVAAARADLDAPGLPVHVVQLARVVRWGPSDSRPGWNAVREAQRTLSQRVESTSCVAAVDLPLSDMIHVSAAGLDRLGRRLARAALGGPELQPVSLAAAEPTANGLPVLRLECAGVSGPWNIPGRVTGFALHSNDGRPHPLYDVVDVLSRTPDGSALEIVLSGYDDQCRLGYALGCDGSGLLADSADMALPVFGPWAVGHQASPPIPAGGPPS